MKVLLIKGNPHKEGCTFTALAEVVRTLHKHDIETDRLYLGNKPVVSSQYWNSVHGFMPKGVNQDEEGGDKHGVLWERIGHDY